MSVNRSYQINPPTGLLSREANDGKIFQYFIDKHYTLSLLEAFRQADRFWSRYYWNLSDGSKICVKLPVILEGKKRREWLEKNIDNPDPKRFGETQRIQEIINRNFIKERFSPIETASAFFKTETSDPEKNLWYKLDEYHGIMLSKLVAKEMTTNISELRPAIRKLGKSQLEKMILQIFDELPNDSYTDANIARSYGLSRATFSRFAGSKWSQNGARIPTLWKATAIFLAKNAIFMELAEKASVREKVKSFAAKSEQPNQL
jgi:hypothetical protein